MIFSYWQISYFITCITNSESRSSTVATCLSVSVNGICLNNYLNPYITLILWHVWFFSAPSRRGDLEILGFCLLQWLCSQLPWENNLENKDYVRDSKIRYIVMICCLKIPCTFRQIKNIRLIFFHVLKSRFYHYKSFFYYCIFTFLILPTSAFLAHLAEKHGCRY